jgi:DNA-directed RNA polymerase I, II, and III subunit RPABC1
LFTIPTDLLFQPKVKELLVNITKHILAPKHEVLSAEEKAIVLKAYSVEDSQVFYLFVTDY